MNRVIFPYAMYPKHLICLSALVEPFEIPEVNPIMPTAQKYDYHLHRTSLATRIVVGLESLELMD